MIRLKFGTKPYNDRFIVIDPETGEETTEWVMKEWPAIYEAEKAIKGPDYVHLLDTAGNVTTSFDGVSDFSGFELLEGEWAESTLEEAKTEKLNEVGQACTNIIYAGIEVNGRQYSLTEHDQIELMGQLSAVKEGAAAVPYHANGELCQMFTAAEFLEIATAATEYIFYHRTYCNHLNAWIRRVEDKAELQDIYYGAALPNDLAGSMNAILQSAAGG